MLWKHLSLLSPELCKVFNLMNQWKPKSLLSKTRFTWTGPSTLLSSSLTTLSHAGFAPVTLACCFLNKPRIFVPQGLCTYHFLCLECSSPLYVGIELYSLPSYSSPLKDDQRWFPWTSRSSNFLTTQHLHPPSGLYFSVLHVSLLDILYIWPIFSLSLSTKHKFHGNMDFVLFFLNT